MEYHNPVMLRESLDGLNIQDNGTYVDLTFGGGGHTQQILAELKGGKVLGFDQDTDAHQQAEKLNDSRFTLVAANFRYLKRYLRLHGIKQVDGILADLGVSSHQFDVPERGFSTRFNAKLDMRMDQAGSKTAESVINEYPESELHKILGMYGEVKNARTLASALVSRRINSPLQTIDDLKEVAEPLAPRNRENKYLAQVFQALRIEVNDELAALEEMLEQAAEVLKPGGRLVVISYHSLEDRLVKNFIAKGKFSGELEKDFYGNPLKPLKPITRKPLEAQAEEVARNNRARSARLRVAEKI
jgi:16S rRNA (cytosine1402-N4)-methyltransferase